MRTSRGLDRLITFLDAVVAIAITLLVLPVIARLWRGHHRIVERVGACSCSCSAGRWSGSCGAGTPTPT